MIASNDRLLFDLNDAYSRGYIAGAFAATPIKHCPPGATGDQFARGFCQAHFVEAHNQPRKPK